MNVAQSKITSQGQVTVPAEIRRRLGLAAGSVIEWREIDGEIVVSRATKYSSREIHQALFAAPPTRKSLDELDEGIRERTRRRHARD